MNKDILILREAISKVVHMLAQISGLTVTQRGTEAYVKTDRVTLKPVLVNIPFIPDDASDDLIAAIQGFLDHEVAHILFTNWKAVKEAYSVSESLGMMHNAVEDTFIEREMAKRFPGCGHNISILHDFFIRKITTPALEKLEEAITNKKVPAEKRDELRFNIIAIPLIRAWSNQHTFADWLKSSGNDQNPYIKSLIAKMPASVIARIPKIKDSFESLEIAKIIEGILHPPAPPAPKQQPMPMPPEQSDEDDECEEGNPGEGKETDTKGKGEKPHKNDSKKADGDEDSGDDKDAENEDGEGDGENGETESEKGKKPKKDKKSKEKEKDADGTGDEGEDSADGSEAPGEDDPGDGGEPDEDGAEGEDDQSPEGASEAGSEDDEGGGDEEDDSDGSSGDPERTEGDGDDADEPDRDGGDEDRAGEDADGGEPDDGSGDGSDDAGDGEEDSDGDDAEDGDGGGAGGGDEDSDGSDEADEGEGDQSGEGDEGDGGDEAGEDEAGKGSSGQEGGDEKSSKRGAEESGEGIEQEAKGDVDIDDSEKEGERTEAKSKMNQPGIGANGPSFSSIDVKPYDFDSLVRKHITDEAIRQTRDSDYSIYSTEFDIIGKHVLSQSYSDRQFTLMDDSVRGMVGVMQKEIERMMAQKNRVFNVGGQKRGKINSPGLYRILSNDPRVFKRREEFQAKDTAVSLVCDNSGSMNGDPCRIAMSAAYALAATLERVNISNEVIGFTTDANGKPGSGYDYNHIESEGRRNGITYSRVLPIRLSIFKEFTERLTPPVRHRFADMAYNQPNMGGNVDGESIQFGINRLLQRKEQRKVMLVLSDGFPAGGERAAINSHLHKVVKDATKAKVEIIGIGIKSTAVQTFYPKSMVLNRVEDLPKMVMGELKRILLAA